MKKRILLTVFLLLAVAVGALCLLACGGESEDGSEETYANLSFQLAPNGSHYVVYGAAGASGDIDIPATYRGLPVAKIGTEAFKDCDNLTSIVIPDSITAIADKAFMGCTKLRSVKLNKVTELGAESFRNCQSLSEVFTDRLAISGRDAFLDCDNLKYVYTPDLGSWSNISFATKTANPMNYAGKIFLNRSRVTDLKIPPATTKIKEYAFIGCNFNSITVPNSVTDVVPKAFFNCKTESLNASADVIVRTPWQSAKNINITGGTVIPSVLTSMTQLVRLTVADSVKEIEASAFHYLSSLKEVRINSLENWCTMKFGNACNPLSYAKEFYVKDQLVKDLVIPETVTEISPRAFEGFRGFKSVDTGKSVVKIGKSAFKGCCSDYTTGLKSVVIGDSVTTIEDYAFSECLCLENLKLGKNLKTIGSHAFGKCEHLQSLTIPSSVESIQSFAFVDCKYLKSLTIPDRISEIDKAAFSGLTSLTSLTIGDGVTKIWDGGFDKCNSLTSVVIGSGVRDIGASGIAGKNLQTVYYKGTEEQWNQVSVYMSDSDTGNYYLNKAKKYFYSETQPETTGNYWHYVDGEITVW